MQKSLGEMLDSRDEFYSWFMESCVSLSVLVATAESGLLEVLDAGPADVGALADQTAIPAGKLNRLADFLIAYDLLERLPDGRLARSAHGKVFKDAAPVIRAVSAGVIGSGPQLYPALRKGITAYEQRHGAPIFQHMEATPGLAASFAGFMQFMTRRMEAFVFSRHRFEPFELAVDVGGSHGGLLLSLMEHYPGTRGILFDLPDVTAQVAPSVRAAAQGERVEIVGGNFFESVPEADLYLIKQILHDWDDDDCIRILKSIHAAIRPGGRIAVIELLLPEVPVPSEALTMDIAMMIVANGEERKLSQFEALFNASGFRLDRVSENPHGQSVIEAVPV